MAVSREDIALIYEQLANKAMDDGLPISRAVVFARRAEDVRAIEAMKPLRRDTIFPSVFVRTESNIW